MTTVEGVNRYSYDNRNWLTAAGYPDGGSQTFSYDPVGNRAGLVEVGTGGSPVRTVVYAYDAANRLLSSVAPGETNSYSYDGAGRQTNQTVNGELRTMNYSFRSQMTSLTDTNASVFSYDFDGDGNRTKQSLNSCLSTRYVYDGPNVVLELNASNQVTRACINGPGIDQPIERIDFVDGVQRARLVYHTDGLGSVVAITDSSQQTAKTYAYEAFGRIRSEGGNGFAVNRYAFTARESLGDSLGLYYYRARVMDPNTGRFTSEDPLGFVDGPNLYGYVANNPINYVDPNGQWLAPARALAAKYGPKALAVGKKVWDKGKQVWKDTSFDGPSERGGRICQIRYKKKPVARLDYHPIPGSNQEDRLHLNIGDGKGKDEIRIPLDPRSLTD